MPKIDEQKKDEANWVERTGRILKLSVQHVWKDIRKAGQEYLMDYYKTCVGYNTLLYMAGKECIAVSIGADTGRPM